MSTINRYIDNQRAYAAKKKTQPLMGFTNAQGEPASWYDMAVTFTDSGGRTLNIFFCNLNKNIPKKGARFTEDDRLVPEKHDLLFAYTLDVLKENVSIYTKQKKSQLQDASFAT
ncbi:hypothetical protein LFREDSHE_22330 [Shewanella baltica]